MTYRSIQASKYHIHTSPILKSEVRVQHSLVNLNIFQVIASFEKLFKSLRVCLAFILLMDEGC